tara:strand:+ start:6217 stop:6831 length:615 start_codon:yes stop_codon:yes gene_type:complete
MMGNFMCTSKNEIINEKIDMYQDNVSKDNVNQDGKTENIQDEVQDNTDGNSCELNENKHGKILETIEYDDTIPFIPPVTRGKVIKVYDGDTITIASKMPWDSSPFFRFSVRLNGIDCPEIRTKNVNEKKCAKMAKEMLSKNILHKIVTLKNVELEKYGRILADVYIQDTNVTDCLIKNHLAVEYHGGKKQCPDDWLEYYSKRNN